MKSFLDLFGKSVDRFSFPILALMLYTIFVGQGCGEKKISPKLEDDLYGKWMIYDALRNGRSTSTLKDGYFQFNQDQTLMTNITGEVTVSSYALSEERITSEEPFPYEFKIMKIGGDSLHLLGKMRSFHLDFYLLKETGEGDFQEEIQETTDANHSHSDPS